MCTDTCVDTGIAIGIERKRERQRSSCEVAVGVDFEVFANFGKFGLGERLAAAPASYGLYSYGLYSYGLYI